MLNNVKSVYLRKQFELIFHADHQTLTSLNKDYDVRNDALPMTINYFQKKHTTPLIGLVISKIW